MRSAVIIAVVVALAVAAPTSAATGLSLEIGKRWDCATELPDRSVGPSLVFTSKRTYEVGGNHSGNKLLAPVMKGTYSASGQVVLFQTGYLNRYYRHDWAWLYEFTDTISHRNTLNLAFEGRPIRPAGPHGQYAGFSCQIVI
jgi:hypothetical protein